MTHATDDLDALCARVREAGFAVFQAPVRVRWADGERRIMLVRGPNEEMFEFREA
jgi:extradiol dioxygenase family protein